MATKDERNAAFDAAEAGLEALIRKRAPAFFEQMAETQLLQHRADVLDMVDKVLDAAEKARHS